MARSEIQVGGTLRELAADAARAWKTAEAGHAISSYPIICFRDWSALSSVLTPKRYDLLRQLRREPAAGVRPLARALDRDVRRVHEDVVALAEIGLITRGEDGSLACEVDEIESTIRLSPAPAVPSYEIPPDMRDMAEKSVDQASRAFDGFINAAQKAAGQVDATTVAPSNAKAMGTKAMGFAETNIRSAFDLARKLVRAKDLQEVLSLQSEYAKSQMSTIQEQAKELGSLMQTNAQRIAQPASQPIETDTDEAVNHTHR